MNVVEMNSDSVCINFIESAIKNKTSKRSSRSKLKRQTTKSNKGYARKTVYN